jgi:hypothetical protein
MKNPILLITAILVLTFTSCVKDNALTEAARPEENSTTYEFEIPAQSGASDRTLTLHYFYLSNAQITGGYEYALTVRRQSDNQIVWESGGWFTGKYLFFEKFRHRGRLQGISDPFTSLPRQRGNNSLEINTLI